MAVRNGDWKLLKSFSTGRTELYNIAEDHLERNNLVNSNPEKAAELEKMWLERKDSLP